MTIDQLNKALVAYNPTPALTLTISTPLFYNLCPEKLLSSLIVPNSDQKVSSAVGDPCCSLAQLF